MVLEMDNELAPWVYGILHGEPTPSGGFLFALAEAANRADPENYPAMRPALLHMMRKYPKYRCQHEPAWRSAAAAANRIKPQNIPRRFALNADQFAALVEGREVVMQDLAGDDTHFILSDIGFAVMRHAIAKAEELGAKS